LRLSRGRAFQLHLENVGTLLVDQLCLSDEEEGSDGKEGDSDDELEAIQSALP